MNLYDYIPYYFLWGVVTAVEGCLRGNIVVKPNSTYNKYFATGYTQENYYQYMKNMRSEDPLTYWLLTIGPNVLAVGLSACILSLIVK